MSSHRKKLIGIVSAALLFSPLVALGAGAPVNRLVEMATSSSRPIVVDFGKGQCVQCIRQAEAIEEIRGQYEDRVGFEFVHVIEEAALSGEYRVFMIPTLVFIDASGRETSRYVGLLEADELKNRIEELGWADFSKDTP
jgi:thioredoxin-like negative regulator of GroEL